MIKRGKEAQIFMSKSRDDARISSVITWCNF